MTTGRPGKPLEKHAVDKIIESAHAGRPAEEQSIEKAKSIIADIQGKREDTGKLPLPQGHGKKFRGHIEAAAVMESYNRIQSLNDLGRMLGHLGENECNQENPTNKNLSNDVLGVLLEQIKSTAAFFDSKEWKDFYSFLSDRISGVDSYAKLVLEEQTSLTDVLLYRLEIMRLAPLFPYIKKELQKKKYDNTSLNELFTGEHDEKVTKPDGTQCTVTSTSKAGKVADNGEYLKPYKVILEIAEKAASDAGLPKLENVTLSSKFMIDKSKLMSLLQEGKPNAEPSKLPANTQLPIALFPNSPDSLLSKVNLMVMVKDLAGLTETIKISEFERQVLDTVNTLYLMAKDRGDTDANTGRTFCAFTAAHVFQVMNHTTKKPSIKQMAEIKAALIRLATLWVEIDNTQLLDVKPHNGYKKIKDAGNLLYLKESTFKSTANGKVIEGYLLLAEPILLENAINLKHIITVDARLFAMDDTKSITSTRRGISGYLARRIDQIKHNPKMNKCIRYDTILNDVEATRGKMQDARNKEYIKTTLDHFIKEAYIKGYEEYTEPGRRAKTGVKIILQAAKTNLS